VSEQVLLRDLVAIPDTVHDGDFVLNLAKGVQVKSTITDYVVTPPLAANFDKALDLVKSALETGASRSAYLDGSFGSGKSHFMAVLYAILKGDPDARAKRGLADVVAKHDKWLSGRKFLLVPLPPARLAVPRRGHPRRLRRPCRQGASGQGPPTRLPRRQPDRGRQGHA
jgi:AFG1-like ATPase